MIRHAATRFVPLVALAVLAAAAAAHEDLDEQLARVDQELLASPGNPDLWLERAALHRLHGDFPEAHTDLGRARSLGAAEDRLVLGEAAVLLDEGRPDAALSRLTCQDAPETSSRWHFLRRCYQALDRRLETSAAWRRELRLDPSPDGYVEWARWALQGTPADTAQALDALQAGLQHVGPAPGLVLEAVDLEAASGAPERALAILDQTPPSLGASPAVLERRAGLLLAAGQREPAREVYSRLQATLEALPRARRAAPAIEGMELRVRQALETLQARQAGR